VLQVTAKMKAVRLHAPGDLRVEEVNVPEINDHQVLVRVRAVGVCGSDPGRVMEKGTYSYPMTIGHEFSGDVAKVGAKVKDYKVGDPVTVVPLIPCGTCEYCRVGKYNLCDDYSYYGSRTDGAMAEYVAVEAANLLKLPEGVDFESGACTDPVAIAFHALRQAQLGAGDTVAILGAGPIGLFAIQWAKTMGATEVFVIDILDEKLTIAREVGADHAINAKVVDPVDFVLKKTEGEGAHKVIEIVGAPVTQEQSLRMVRKEGTVVFCGISYKDLVIPVKTLDGLLRKELRIIGAWNSLASPYPINEWELALRFMALGRVKCKPVISHRFRLDEAPDVFRRLWKREEFFSKIFFLP